MIRSKRRLLLGVRIGLLLVVIGTGLILFDADRSLGPVSASVLALAVGFVVLAGAGYLGIKMDATDG